VVAPRLRLTSASERHHHGPRKSNENSGVLVFLSINVVDTVGHNRWFFKHMFNALLSQFIFSISGPDLRLKSTRKCT
jgi:hypothetical protein